MLFLCSNDAMVANRCHNFHWFLFSLSMHGRCLTLTLPAVSKSVVAMEVTHIISSQPCLTCDPFR